MDKVLVVCPVVDERISDTCLYSILKYPSSLGITESQILLVDNSEHGFAAKYGIRFIRSEVGHNLGVARAWNLGVQEVLDKKLDYLVLMSASMYFGPILHCTFLTQMQTFWGSNVIEATGHGWHLIAFNRRVFETIGMFDENFYPAYFEDVDFGRRIYLSQMNGKWENVWINAISQGNALHVRSEMVSAPATPLLKYYEEKWGGGKENEKFMTPFNTGDMTYWPKNDIETLVKKYDLKKWW